MPQDVPGPDADAAEWLAYCEAAARTVPDLTRRVELTVEQFERLCLAVPDERRAPTLPADGHLGGWGPFEFWIPLGNGRKVRSA